MTTETHVVWTNELVEASNYTINDNEEVHLLTSSEIDNSSGTIYNSLKCTIEYSGLTPDVTGVN